MKKNILFLLLSILSLGLSQISCASNMMVQNSGNTQNEYGNNSIGQALTTNETKDVTQTYVLPDGETYSGKSFTLILGYNGKEYKLNLFNNQTAEDIYRHVSTSTWNLPIYNFSDYENADKYQYYDVPSRYKIESNAKAITKEYVGEIYYSEPNRIVMFYRDADIPVNYTRVGVLETDDNFTKNVEENPTLQGWGNKIITIKR